MNVADKSPFVVSADWLQERLGQPGLSILDASWYLPAQKRDAKAEYEAAHIPGAIFFDHEEMSDPDSSQPHTLLNPEAFAAAISSMGITNDDTIVVYDGPGMTTSPRVWWMLRTFGAKNVSILDGGFDNWKNAGRPVTDAVTKIAPSAFVPNFNASKVLSAVAVSYAMRLISARRWRHPLRRTSIDRRNIVPQKGFLVCLCCCFASLRGAILSDNGMILSGQNRH